jgi:hypothetical protein
MVAAKLRMDGSFSPEVSTREASFARMAPITSPVRVPARLLIEQRSSSVWV